MSDNQKKQPKSDAFSIPKIFLCCVFFIIMVRSDLWVNFIILFLIVMYLLPLGLANKFKEWFQSKDFLAKTQSFVQHWYEANVAAKQVAKPNPATSSLIEKPVDSEDKILEETETDFFETPDPQNNDFIHPSHKEIWGSYQGNEEDNNGN